MHFRFRGLAALAPALLLFAAAAAAEPLQLAPYKDELFAYPKVLESSHGGDYLTIEFSQARDVIARDVEPDEKTRPEYVSLDVKAVEEDMVLKADGVTVNYVGVGRTAGEAKVVVVFIHGLGADRFDGVNDWRSGGNINRIKNLMVLNGGVYLSPDYSNRRRLAIRQMKALIARYAQNSPGAPIFLACASIGARLCIDLTEDKEVRAVVDGMIMIAPVPDLRLTRRILNWSKSAPIPILISQGSGDNLVNWRPHDQLFRKVKSSAPDYPIKFTLFRNGTHRTPLRMTDWRLVLNWMLAYGAGSS